MLTDSTQMTIELSSVYKAYGKGNAATPVLRGVDLRVTRGECVFLAGPSGSGKSTLLSILGCILTPDQGKANILGADIATLDAQQRAVLRLDRIGFVFQRFNLIRGLTALENVCVPLMLRGIDDRLAKQHAAHLLNEVGLADKATSQPRALSAGQCQRIALARALAGDPELILADEPTASLDAANGESIMQLLRKLTTEHGKTTVVVTHDQRILKFADRVLQLDGGRISVSAGEPTKPFARQEALVSI